MPIQHFRSKKPPFPLPWSWRRHKNIYKVFPSCLPTHDILNDKISNSNSTNPGHHFSWLNHEKPPFLYIFHGFWWNSPFLMLRTPRDPVTPWPRCASFDTKPAGRRMALKTTLNRWTESSGARRSKVGLGWNGVWDKATMLTSVIRFLWFFLYLETMNPGFFWPNFGEYPIISPQS